MSDVADREILDAVAAVEGPLYSSDYGTGMGTLYTAAYEPGAGVATYRWQTFSWRQSFERFEAGTRTVQLLETSAA